MSGAGSTWDNSAALYVGYEGTGLLTINSGAIANVGNFFSLGELDAGTSTANVSGTVDVPTGDSFVGNLGDGTLTISAGGMVSNVAGRIGNASGTTGAATVTGARCTWTNSDLLEVGNHGAATLQVLDGGVVTNNAGLIIASFSNSNSMMTVDGVGSNLNNAGHIHVGSQGVGTLTINNGGTVSATQIDFIGTAEGSGTLTVDGIASSWTSESLYITGTVSQGSSGAGTLNINSGTVTVANTIKLRGGATLSLDGGNLTTGSFINTSGGTFNFASSAESVGQQNLHNGPVTWAAD